MAAKKWVLAAGALALAVLTAMPLMAQQFQPDLLAGMRWRQVGPFRGGRVSAVAGVAGRPGIYYMASAGGGVWKTVDGGTVWKPIFDAEHVASIGAVAVAPSNADILYVGTGDVSDVGGALNDGDGVYRSDNGGRTWRHLGLAATRHIGAILVDPKNPDIVLVAALGPAYRKSPDRGVYLSQDGGQTWQKTLFKDDVTGAVDLAFDSARPGVVYAALWRHYEAPPPAPFRFAAGGGGAIYKSTDEGQTWTPLMGHGLPASGMGRIGLAAHDGRIFAIVGGSGRGHAAGLYRSDDGGQSWRRITQDPRIVGSGYFSHVWMDPQNSNIVFVAQTSLYRSVDGGRTFSAYKGAPGGDDYHELWIDPKSPCVPMTQSPGCRSSDMVFGSDQGASVSFDGGHSWSTWYNQPTGQFYHISTDERFPFRIYGTQQDSGSVQVRSRGAFGDINFLDWRPSMGAYEFGYILPDPAHPQWVFASGAGPQLNRMTRGIWRILDVSPYIGPGGPYRYVSSPPFVFSPQNGNVLYFGVQYLLATADGGRHWRRLGPDLTRRRNLPARRIFGHTVRQWAAISALAPSPAKAGVIWAGTNDGLVQVTRDGGRQWARSIPPGLTDLDTIAMIAASPRDPAAAYVVVDRYEFGDYRPYIFRTRDFGHTWRTITRGIPAGDIVRVVRVDPRRAGLLYAGTEDGVFVSFDDGGQWQSLQLNLPTASVRDLRVRDGDLVAATYGRAIWILDDLSPLRQLTAAIAGAPAHLFQPRAAIRLSRDANFDTPLPPEIPAGTNPPTGAILDYSLAAPPRGLVRLAVYDAAGHLVRQFSSAPLPPAQIRPVKWPVVPDYWMANPRPLPAHAGLNRFVWDLRYPDPLSLDHSYPISAILHGTPAEPIGPQVVPGNYTVKLTVDGQSYSQSLVVRRDPREVTSDAAFAAQLQLAQQVIAAMQASYADHQAVQAWLAAPGRTAAEKKAAQALDQGRRDQPGFARLNGELGQLLADVESPDAAPTAAMAAAARQFEAELQQQAAAWARLGGGRP